VSVGSGFGNGRRIYKDSYDRVVVGVVHVVGEAFNDVEHVCNKVVLD